MLTTTTLPFAAGLTKGINCDIPPRSNGPSISEDGDKVTPQETTSTTTEQIIVPLPTQQLLEEQAPEARCNETKGLAREEELEERSLRTLVASQVDEEKHHSANTTTSRSSTGKLRELKKLYGRSREQETMLQAYTHGIQGGAKSLVVVKGSVGIGKTAVAQSICHKVMQEDRGFFITWRFDHESQLESGDGFNDAFTSLRDQILASGEEVVQSIRDGIRAFGPVDCAIILGLIPMLAPIIGEAEADVDPFGVEGSGRVLGIFKKMMRVLGTQEHPLVILFDNVQFSDSCSHALLSALILDPDHQGSLYMFTMGPEEPTASIDKVLEGYEETVNITNIVLEPLDEATTNLMIADSLRVELNDCAPMAKFLYYYTKGNPLFVKEMLRLMFENEVLVFDEDSKTWDCKEKRMDCVYQCKNFETLVRNKFVRLSDPVKEVLKAAACLGTKIDVVFLDVAMSAPVDRYLRKAVSAGLVIVADEGIGRYRFANNGIRQAAYALIPEEDRETFHLALGRKLLKGFTEEQLEEHLTLILRQIKRGANSITSQDERYSVAALCLKAAKQAVVWSNFEMAAEALDFGINLLGDRCWRDEYDLSLAVYNIATEVAFAIGSHPQVHERADIVLSNARVLDHKLHVYCTKLNSLSVSAKVQEAIDLGLDVLHQIGEPVRSKPSKPYVVAEYARMRRFMRSNTLEKLRRLPSMTDDRKAAAMQIINLLAVPTMFGRPLVMPLLAFKAVRLTVTHGLCAISAVAFGLYGFVLAGFAGKYEDANQLAELSLELLERFDAKQWLPRVHMAVYSSIFSWSKDLSSCIEPLQRGYDVGIETGDVEFALLNSNMKCVFMFCAGSSLPVMKKEMDKYTEEMTKLNQESMLIIHKGLLFVVEAFMESNSIEYFDQLVRNDKHDVGEEMSSDVLNHCWFVFKKMALAYVMGDYVGAVVEADSIPLHKIPVSGIDFSFIVMFDALARIACCRQTGKNKRKTLALARNRISTLRRYTKANPRFCLGIQVLVEAEVAAMKGKHAIATEKYFSCISMFLHRNMLLQHGIASECAGRYMMERGKQDAAKEYLCESRQVFADWGATGKCNALASEIDELFGKERC